MSYTYTYVPNGNLETGKPARAVDIRAIRDMGPAIAMGAEGAPYMEGWRAYDSAVVGDGKVGLIYSYATMGQIYSVLSPVFEPGWDYRLLMVGVYASDGVNQNIVMRLFSDGSPAFEVRLAYAALQFSWFELSDPATSRVHMTIEHSSTQTSPPNDAIVNLDSQRSVHAFKPARPRTQISIRCDKGSIRSGEIYMYRRRASGGVLW